MDQIDPDDQLVEAPNAAERRWIDEQLAVLRDHEVALTFPGVAAAFAAMRAEWSTTALQEREGADAGVDALGVGFGQLLVQELGLRWVVVHDHTGTDLAVTGEPNGIMVFPIGALAQRWARPDESIDGFGEWIVEQVLEARAGATVQP